MPGLKLIHISKRGYSYVALFYGKSGWTTDNNNTSRFNIASRLRGRLITMTSHKGHGVSGYRQLQLFDVSFKLTT